MSRGDQGAHRSASDCKSNSGRVRRVARYGDGWLPMNHTLDMLPASLQKLGTLWDEQGRSGRPQISIGLQVESADDVRRMADAGIDRLIIAPWQRTSGALDGISRFADEIIGQL